MARYMSSGFVATVGIVCFLVLGPKCAAMLFSTDAAGEPMNMTAMHAAPAWHIQLVLVNGDADSPVNIESLDVDVSAVLDSTGEEVGVVRVKVIPYDKKKYGWAIGVLFRDPADGVESVKGTIHVALVGQYRGKRIDGSWDVSLHYVKVGELWESRPTPDSNQRESDKVE